MNGHKLQYVPSKLSTGSTYYLNNTIRFNVLRKVTLRLILNKGLCSKSWYHLRIENFCWKDVSCIATVGHNKKMRHFLAKYIFIYTSFWLPSLWLHFFCLLMSIHGYLHGYFWLSNTSNFSHLSFG
jgi:hypothetical protein